MCVNFEDIFIFCLSLLFTLFEAGIFLVLCTTDARKAGPDFREFLSLSLFSPKECWVFKYAYSYCHDLLDFFFTTEP